MAGSIEYLFHTGWKTGGMSGPPRLPAPALTHWEGFRHAVHGLGVRSAKGAGCWFAHHYLQPEAELDEGFRSEVERLSVAGLRTIGLMTVLVAVMTPLVYWLLPTAHNPICAEVALGTFFLGLATYGAGHTDRFRSSARLLGSAAILLLSAALMATGFFDAELAQGMAPTMGLRLCLVLLITLVSLPLHPIHTTRLAVAQVAVYGGISMLAFRSGSLEPTLTAPVLESLTAILFVMVLGIALSATVYRRIFENYQSQSERLRLAEQMSDTQSRALVAENAAVVGRLAAALSHELNSPIAVVSSGVETLDRLWDKAAEAPPEKQVRLRVAREDLSSSIREATTRMQQMVKRMQRFSNLDGGDVLPVDVNAVLSDVTGLLSPQQRRRSRVELDLQVVPETVGRPEQINRAFESLIHGVLRQVEQEGTLRVRTREHQGSVAVTLDYEGFGATAAAFDSDLDLTFKVTGKRMAADNWDLVTARQIIEEHAGEIRLHHHSEGRIRITVVLPAGSESNVAAGQAQPGEQQGETKERQCLESLRLKRHSQPRAPSHSPA
jgi:signal transduction histidine kinase